METLVVIPARLASSRLPGKPLVPLCGVPMIVRTWRRCALAVDPSHILVATDDVGIADVCAAHGIRAVMTSPDCLTGTDRVAEVAEKHPAQTYINVQGDEPLFDPADLRALVDAAGRHPTEVINGFCSLDSEADYLSRSIPKVVVRPDGRLLYMSRAPIPGAKDARFHRGWRQVCAYAFPRAALQAFAALGRKSPLEAIEDIEILRFLELGFEVRMIELSQSSIAVDHPEDVVRAEAALVARGQV